MKTERTNWHRRQELLRTAELLVELADRKPQGHFLGGVFFVVAFLHDSGYGNDRLRDLLPDLEQQPGAVKKAQ